ncbi:MAG: hypothetical protein RI992_465, partial [Actinomycetota bacterium]
WTLVNLTSAGLSSYTARPNQQTVERVLPSVGLLQSLTCYWLIAKRDV